ncbi:hypothetical protein niasHT_004185 [Heterodera trifolii]|uniref:C2 domain-containing protein n=1 Tax=Heterodera trifolii TaxID=157864 RepID=A0ABD2ME12_9BILA
MQRRFSCTTGPDNEGTEPCISSTTSSSSIGPTGGGQQQNQQQQQQRTLLSRSITPTALPTSSHSASMRARSLRRTSAQESVDSAFQLLTGGNRRKGSADAYVGQLQPDLYRRRGSVISVSSSGGGAQVVGRVQLQLSYDHSTSDVVIRLAQMNLLHPSSASLGQCHKLRLLCTTPCSSNNNSNNNNNNGTNCSEEMVGTGRVGRRARETGALTFDMASGQCNNLPKEPLKLPLDYAELAQAVLHVELLAQTAEMPPASAATVEACAGAISAEVSARRAACSVPLCPLGPSADDLTVWADLERTEETFTRGELLLCLQYLPAAERLTLSVHQASNLRLANGGNARGNGLPSDVFVRAQLIGPDDKVLKRRKSAARKRTMEPVWDEVLSFEADASTLPRCRLEVQLVGSDRFGRGERLIGQVHFGSTASGGTGASSASARMSTAARLWRDAIERQWSVPRWVVLEAPLDIAAGGGAILE